MTADAGPAPDTRRSPCVLIVEDDDDVRQMMEHLLTSSGYTTMAARNGEEALARMRQRRPCLVLLDLQMPVMSGWEFRDRQLLDQALADVPVICVTSYFDPHDVTERLGVPCLMKPADLNAVVREVETACGRA